MALLFIDGFDHYDPQQLDSFGAPWLARGKAAYLSPQATRINGRRPSSFGLRLPEGPGGGYVRNLDTPRTSLIVGAAVRVAPHQNTGAEPLLIGVRDVNSQVAHLVKIGEDGRLKLYRWQHGWDQLISTSVASAPARGWHYIELQVTQGVSNGVLSVRLNGILAIHMTAQNTTQGGGQLLTAFIGAFPGQPCPVTLDVDDCYIADTTGTINNSFLGDVRVDALRAQANGGLNQWTVIPVANLGNMAAWAVVSDEDEATAISAPSAGLRQSFDVEPLPVMASPAIHGVQLTLLARKTDAGMGRMRGLAVSGAQSAVSPDIILQEQLAWQSALFERNPNGAVQWTQAAFNAAEFGVESV
ncbi:PKD repeat protein [Serpentinimonas maccroryi]|uniref:PKD repeat protein n=1 Tax=Serpentinimonas maccroryi TaxID=1458426 RepID=A0A060NNI4_9BURK|nr:hypothetical protein [Serpentinimonas maccroryi]BAO82910.1 PKD repeat protein [Serpentinimonas maccroryi]